MLCEYGCGQEAKYQLKNGKWCCSEVYVQCPSHAQKNLEIHKHPKYKECPYCHKEYYALGGQYNCHVKKCKTLFDKKQRLETRDITKYIKWYNNIIQNRQEHPLVDGYREKHHILPHSLGGSNDVSNLIYLTAREHYICHMLLVEIYSKDKKSYTKMLSAFMLMKTRENSDFKVNSRLYEYYRTELSKLRKNTGCGENNNNYGKVWICNPSTKETKPVPKEQLEDYYSQGWEKGRVIDWDIYYAKKNKIILRNEFYKLKREEKRDYINKQIYNRKHKIEKDNIRREENKKIFQNYLELYRRLGWNGFVKETNYKYSRQNLIQGFRRYLKEEFIPLNQNPKKKK